MNQTTLGERIATLRRQKNLTQEALAEALSVSPQAVSKWENNVSCPDIMLLPDLARMLGVTVDALLASGQEPETRLVPATQRKDPDTMILKVVMSTSDGDQMRVNLPLALLRMGLSMNVENMSFNGRDVNLMRHIDVDQVLRMADSGVIGKLVEIDSNGGDHIEVWVE